MTSGTRSPRRVYPGISYPALPSKAPGYVDYYNRLSGEAHARSAAANDEYNRLILKLQQPNPRRSPLSSSRGSDIYLEMLKVPLRAGQVKCSEVSFYTDAKWNPRPLLSGFGKMGYAGNAQGGTLTVGFGSKAGAGPVDFQSGLQLTLKQHYGGTDVDLAWRVGPSAGPKSDIVDITIFKSVAPPQASPSFPSS